MHVNWKDPKVIAGLGIGALALWFFFLRTPPAQKAGATGTATTASDQGAQAAYSSQGQAADGSGSSGGSSGGGAGAADLSGMLDSILANSSQTHAYDLAYLGSFSAGFLNYAAMADQQFAGLATNSNDALVGLATSVINRQPLDPAQATAAYGAPTPGYSQTEHVASTTNQPRPLPQPIGTSPYELGHGISLAAGPPSTQIFNSSFVGPVRGQVATVGSTAPPVVPVNHGRGLGGPQG